jgi:hypothetical protein
MPSIIPCTVTEEALRDALTREGYLLSRVLGNGETGVDILATKGTKSIHIEVIGFKSSPPARSRDFFQTFFRAVSRIKDGATRCVVALPARWEAGLPARARQYAVAWERLGIAFPELEIWLVDHEARSYTRTTWNEWLSTATS